ncbi:hypothetical protein [Epilithonimonas caeni]|uniref:hypothetical protein n=1 Tax=Epilithonimonas caeni TaxID=365343 RepID=UPI000414E45C|nr:hypothetical protein [Epilithonimonas caeni]
MMKITQIKWDIYQKSHMGSKLFTLLLFLSLCCNSAFGQLYINEGTVVFVADKAFICENEVVKIPENFSDTDITGDTLDFTVNEEISVDHSINEVKKKVSKPEPEIEKIVMTEEVATYNFSSGTDQYFTFFKKNGNIATVLIQNPNLLIPFQPVVEQDKDFTFFSILSPEKLSELYKNSLLYSSSAIRPPPSEDVLPVQSC